MKKQTRNKLILVVGIILVVGSLFIINKVTLNARIYNRCELIMREQPYEAIEIDEEELNVSDTYVIDAYVIQSITGIEYPKLVHACEVVADQYNMTYDEVCEIYLDEYCRRNIDIK